MFLGMGIVVLYCFVCVCFYVTSLDGSVLLLQSRGRKCTIYETCAKLHMFLIVYISCGCTLFRRTLKAIQCG